MNYQVFVSYRRMGGEALAYLVYEKLSNLGYKVFYDIESLSSGKFNTKLYEVIDLCKDVIVILPPGGLDRCADDEDWLRYEISYAIEKGKNLIPVFMNGFQWPENMPDNIIELKNYNGVNVTFDFFDGFIRKLQKNLVINEEKNLLHKEGQPLKHILMWGDFESGVLNKLIKRLDMDKGYYFEILIDPVEILSKELSCIDTIVLIDTDVTKLSNNDEVIQKINDTLIDYVDSGGRLVVTHDLIYRRTRNDGLQKLLGCRITNFQSADIIKYKKTDLCNELNHFSELPDEFELHDGEFCWGQYAPDVEVFFETEDGIPLVFSREYGNGVCVWMNPGDYKEYPPQSIVKPEKEFIQMLKEAILIEY